MPVLEEELYLEESVRRVLAQDYPGEWELILAIGPSKDRTQEIAERLAAADERITLVANPSGYTPNALNAALAVARHEYVVRVDAHGFLPPRYVERVVALLDETGAANVGGLMRVEGDSPFGDAVAAAMTSPLGIGGASFHTGGEAGPALTVYLGSFRRSVLEAVGGFDEHYRRAQDWELNYRIRKSGGVVWFDPDLAVTYRPRRDFKALARQFFGSGQWRRQIVEEYPDTASVRYLAPPTATALVLGGTVLGLIGVVGAARGNKPVALGRLGFLAPGGYAAAVLAGSAVVGQQQGLSARARVLLPPVVATMHLAWGWGFLRGIDKSLRR
ncbi:glycosyltransferase family 2 protein [Nocardioides sp. AE5]|uniref:glycosyltransferase family 2 protein n=1 Tax=Nocardioides sp. AE5 TaxID=2962573 RepID=UPI0028827A03|nr:glycosyltransferase family 2 protein [Nocardioides sp. AE5]MDT0203798.1 glycosyltransferase family 2 protein [Nocardioides sp. AE5]